MCTTLFAVAVLATGCQPSNDQVPDAVPPGAIPAAPDVRPGVETGPVGVRPAGEEDATEDLPMPADSASDTLFTSVDTVGMQRP